MTFQPAFAAEKECPKGDVSKSGTFEAKITTVGFIVGARWGEGTLTLNDGSQNKIHLSGVKLLETGAAKETLTGEVLNLSKLEDFEGDYGMIETGLTIGKSIAGGATMSNDNCVYEGRKRGSEAERPGAWGDSDRVREIGAIAVSVFTGVTCCTSVAIGLLVWVNCCLVPAPR